ncbi:ATP-binding protein [Arachnia propionica]|uniref:ATP-binding protein n=1 Tax=Arachnia propionica TaxID=1750 RepID=A0A3P1X0T5_9ACTN|nr:DUF4143 domain-containing protein [Arachnia propionica]RRD50323.1 ATP-binding protein [Arachnia propionica]
MYVRRTVDTLLDALLPRTPAIALDGARGVGRTATALQRANRVLPLERPDQRALVGTHPAALLQPGTTLIDEWSRMPEVWDLTHREVNNGAPPGSFILTGSAAPTVGSVLSLRMRPMALHERGPFTTSVSLSQLLGQERPCSSTIEGDTSCSPDDYLDAIESSGFPGFMGLDNESRREQLATYIQEVIDRDLPGLGYTARRTEALRRWLTAYAAATSTTTSYSNLLGAATGDSRQPNRDTVSVYRNHLTRLRLLDPVPGWSPTHITFARLQRAPKHHLVDPALAASLLGATAASMRTPRHSHLAGPLFEALATLSVRVAAEAARAEVLHLRTRNGDHDVDLVVERPDGRLVAMKVQLSDTVSDWDVRHLLWLRSNLPEQVSDLVVLTTGGTARRRSDGVAVVPLALLGP